MIGIPLNGSDLAPGDQRSADFDWRGFEVIRITSPREPLFDLAYSRLWKEFGNKNEMEDSTIITDRLNWNSEERNSGYSLGYEMVVVLKEGRFAAVRDHSAIIRHTPSAEAIVHLSHVLIDPLFRGTGLIGWLRSLPIQKARSCFQAVGLSVDHPITLVAEAEPFDATIPERVTRLKSYGKAGFLMIDPDVVPYLQPDFKAPAIIDQEGGAKPVPLQLLVRRVGRESEQEIKGAEVKQIASALYHMYGKGFREEDMKVVWKRLHSSYPKDDVAVPLIQPYKGSVL